MKKIIALLLAAVLLLGMLPVSALAEETEPALSNGVYQIGTAQELVWFANAVNGGETSISGALTADIDLSGISWPGIGTSGHDFTGSFDGNNHTVTFQNSDWGLFVYATGTADKVVTIQNVNTRGSVKHSAIAHVIKNVHITGCINRATVSNTSAEYVGGIAGSVTHNKSGITYQNDVLIQNCGNEASVTGSRYVGGIVGSFSMVNTRVDSCYNAGNIHGTENVGGITGWAQQYKGECSIKNSYNTGRITGSTSVGGIAGFLQNGVTVANCYNAGSSTYAIVGKQYNTTNKINNCYFLGTASAKSVPDFTTYESEEPAYRAGAKTGSEMAGAEFAQLLGSAFQQSCPTPVLTWQTAKAHTGAVCDNCSLGSTEKEQYDVSFQEHDGFTVLGDAKATQGEAYTFSVQINDGYEKDTHTFCVKVNGEAVSAASDGTFTVLNVSSPMSITVFGVQVIPGSHSIQLPAAGNGYRVEGEKTAVRDSDYNFTISFMNGFKAGKDFKVVAQEIVKEDQTPEEKTLTAVNGVYTIPTVQKNYRILVSGVQVVSSGVTATVNFSITRGYNDFHVAPGSGDAMIDQVLEVPYFDLSLYGLERYYYNPYCYVDEHGEIRTQQKKGTPESAYDNITAMHALIAATERFVLEYDPEDVGTGRSYQDDPEAFENAISWTQDAGSSFMDFWDHGNNMNYYINYEYPLAYAGWGGTSDQILIKDGDVMSLHLITGNASGSRFGFFEANDTDKKYTKGDKIDYAEVDQGESINLTLYWTSATATYDTGYEAMGGKELYWVKAGNETAGVKNWNRADFGGTTAARLVTDSKGTVTISTAGLEPGTYYLATLGGWTEGGGMSASGSTAGTGTSGGEAGPALFKLKVNEYNGKLGDVDGKEGVNAADAAEILKFVTGQTTQINHAIADVDGKEGVNAADAAEILKFVTGQIASFPAENNS